MHFFRSPNGTMLKSSKFQIVIMSKFGNYVQEAYDELVHKVSWPSWDELQQTTLIVLVALLVITAIIFGMDVISDQVLTFIYKRMQGL